VKILYFGRSAILFLNSEAPSVPVGKKEEGKRERERKGKGAGDRERPSAGLSLLSHIIRWVV